MKKEEILIVDGFGESSPALPNIFAEKYRVYTADTGKGAVDFLMKKQPDLILMNAKLPDADGIELYGRMKEEGIIGEIPVAFLATERQNDTEVKAFEMGAMDFFVKPFIPEILLTRVGKILRMAAYTRKIEMAANQDNLTELWNRNYLVTKVHEYLSDKDAKGMLLILDLDNFKSINDTYGHIIGDSVLIKFAEVLRRVIRKDDLACRIGGDEFILFLKGNISREQGAEKAMEILKSMEYCIRDAGAVDSEASVSIGIAMAPCDGTEFKQLYQNADRALYYMKQNGKCGYHFYSAEGNGNVRKDNHPSTKVDLQQLRCLVEEAGASDGAFQVEYEGFRRIYQFVSRCISRTKQNVQMLLLTIYEETNVEVGMEELNEAMRSLEEAIQVSLRRGDVANHFSNSQFFVILMDSTQENGLMVAERIKKNYFKSKISRRINLKYDVQELSTQHTETR